MARKITGNYEYWFLLKSGRAVWVHKTTCNILVEHSDHLLYEPTKVETDEITVEMVFNSFTDG